jgi:mRNA-degrading endonuclease RelE of RelBE toxin-antitoxin system
MKIKITKKARKRLAKMQKKIDKRIERMTADIIADALDIPRSNVQSDLESASFSRNDWPEVIE